MNENNGSEMQCCVPAVPIAQQLFSITFSSKRDYWRPKNINNEKKNARLELARLKYLKLVGRDYLTLQYYNDEKNKKCKILVSK